MLIARFGVVQREYRITQSITQTTDLQRPQNGDLAGREDQRHPVVAGR
ncbi:hypothetical protein [Saccharothrix ecbatanensis]